MSLRIGLRLIVLTVTALVLVGCTGLPTSGPPNAGLAIGDEPEDRFLTPRADGPRPGDTPEQIVAGFLEAGKTPANSWEIARQFLTRDFAARWKPETGVSIDSSVVTREFESDLADADEQTRDDATSAEVRVELDQVASVDSSGSYSADVGAAKSPYRLVRDAEGEWRISEGIDGITLDTATFELVYEKFSLRYFDTSWSHLVSDMRWFPRRRGMATTISSTLISGKPSEWLAPAVRTAFSSDISLVGDAVIVDDERVATVPLNRSALEASPTELSRMRTQLQASLQGAGVSEVRLVVDGVSLGAELETVDDAIVDPGVLVLTPAGFGTASSGGELAPVTKLSSEIGKITDPIRAVDVSIDGTLAAVQLQDGRVYALSAGTRNQVDSERTELIAPSLDPFGFLWTVPENAPRDVQAWSAEVVPHPVALAWSPAERISHMRVAADGTRVAAVLSSGGNRVLVVAAIIRGEDHAPTELGEMHTVAQLDAPVQSIAWVGSDSIVVLGAGDDPELTTYPVGGPSTVSAAPADAVSVAGAKTVTGLRVLSADGVVSAQRGSFWQESVGDVLVLGTRAGY